MYAKYHHLLIHLLQVVFVSNILLCRVYCISGLALPLTAAVKGKIHQNNSPTRKKVQN